MPREWTPEQKAKACEEILAQVEAGLSLREVCRNGDDWMPAESTFRLWCDNDADLNAQYARAREVRADVIFDEMIDIADNANNDWMERQGEKSAGWVLNGDHVQRSRLMIDTRKWMLGKMQPKKYGDKVLLGSDPENPLPEHRTIIATMTPQEAAEAYASTLTSDKG